MKFMMVLVCCAAMCCAQLSPRRIGQRQRQNGGSQAFLVPFNLDELDNQDFQNGQPQTRNREQGILSSSDLTNVLRNLGFDGSNRGVVRDNNQFQRRPATTLFSSPDDFIQDNNQFQRRPATTLFSSPDDFVQDNNQFQRRPATTFFSSPDSFNGDNNQFQRRPATTSFSSPDSFFL